MVANVQSIVLRGTTAWHGLGTVIPNSEDLNSEKARILAGLDWEPELIPLYAKQATADGNYDLITSPARGVRRSDNLDIIGVVGKTWKPIYNKDMFDFLDSLTSTGQADYESAGVLGKGEIVWGLIRLPGVVEVTATDVLERYILAANAHDGTMAFSSFATTVRVVCQNTLSEAIALAANAQRVHHRSKTMAIDLETARENLKQVVRQFEKNAEESRLLASVSVSSTRASEYFGNVLTRILNVTQHEQNQKAEQAREEAKASVLDAVLNETQPQAEEPIVSAKYEKLLGNILERYEKEHSVGTAWGAYNAVSEYVDHGHNYRNSKTRFKGTILGEGNQQKQRAFKLAMEEFVK